MTIASSHKSAYTACQLGYSLLDVFHVAVVLKRIILWRNNVYCGCLCDKTGSVIGHRHLAPK